jgi:hypothetical protein
VDIEKDRADFYSRFFSFVVNKLTYSESTSKLFNKPEYIKELLKMLTTPHSFADRFVCLKTISNVIIILTLDYPHRPKYRSIEPDLHTGL